jgi:hypothetical protein
MFLAGNPEQPGRTVRGAQVMPDAVTLDPGNVGPSLGETPQRRRTETPEADHNHVFAQNVHQKRTLAVRSPGGK